MATKFADIAKGPKGTCDFYCAFYVGVIGGAVAALLVGGVLLRCW